MPKILVVEDEVAVALELEESLTREGYEVVGVARSGEEAADMARRFRPDLILMDIVLKGEMDGIDAAGKIRQELDIPVVFLTGHSQEELIDRAKSTKPYGYILKPLHKGQIRAAIEIALHNKERKMPLRDVGNESDSSKSHRLFSNQLPEKLSGFTPRELRVADLVGQGKSTKEIAELLHLSTETISWHRKNIRNKLGLNNKRSSLMTNLVSFSR